METYVFDRPGTSEVLRTITRPDRPLTSREVRIDVTHAGVNFAEVMFRRGQFPVELPYHPGLEVVGTISEVGTEVRTIAPGTRVAALTRSGGGYATSAVVAATEVFPLDGDLAGLSSVSAVAGLCNVAVAVGVLDNAARPHDGDVVVVAAAAGGVGSAIAQLCRQQAPVASVIGLVSSPAKQSAAMRWGYDAVFLNSQLTGEDDLFPHGVDVFIDSVGGPIRQQMRRHLNPLGRHAVFGDAAQQDITIPANEAWFTAGTVAGYNIGLIAETNPAYYRQSVQQALAHVAAGRVTLEINLVGFADAARAHDLLETRTSTGKYVLDVGRR